MSSMTIVTISPDYGAVRGRLRAFLDTHPAYRVIGQSPTGIEGIAIVEELQPDAALVDCDLEDMYSLDVINTLSRHVPRTGIIGLAPARLDWMQTALLAGAHNVLVKPLDAEDTYRTIWATIANRLHAREAALKRRSMF